MITIEDFKAEHWHRVTQQPAMTWTQQFLSPEQLSGLEKQYSYTFRHEGKIVMCGGVVKHWEGRGEAWAYVAEDAGRHFVTLTKMARRALAILPFVRIEATVDKSFSQAHRWLMSLGFEMEAPLLRRYFPDGRDGSLYSRVK